MSPLPPRRLTPLHQFRMKVEGLIEKGEDMQQHFKLLGYKVKDTITGFKGVLTSISFDLYGCVQGLVTPERDEKSGKQIDSYWHDMKRLIAISKAPVMAVPDFVHVPGPQSKPSYSQQP